MDNFTATMIVEGNWELAGIDEDAVDTEELYIEAVQHLIDTGLAWTLQGHFGRIAQHMVDAGYCHA